ncbi:MAG TPA: hypothetical protein VFA45_05325 [Actinomycetes bacterium]|nr:hypothetical protein [Actinomycetes bacterium]
MLFGGEGDRGIAREAVDVFAHDPVERPGRALGVLDEVVQAACVGDGQVVAGQVGERAAPTVAAAAALDLVVDGHDTAAPPLRERAAVVELPVQRQLGVLQLFLRAAKEGGVGLLGHSRFSLP